MRLLLLITLIVLLPSISFAQIYKWVDDQGIAHYTSTKPNPEAKPADLPEIMRGEFKLKKKPLESCEKHGGIDCQAGPDSDGSVVCRNGYRDASLRFMFSCSSARLMITDVSEIDAFGEFKVFVRNTNSVEAKAPQILYHHHDGSKILLNGPEKIEPFGVAEFQFQPKGDIVATSVSEAQLTLSCENCS